MLSRYFSPAAILFSLSFAALPGIAGQAHQPTAPQKAQAPKEDDAAIARGRTAFQSSCGFCHGNDATGNRAPDLLRSTSLSHDENGSTVGPIIHNGRPDKGMPAFPNIKDTTVTEIVSFLHHQANQALRSGRIPGDYAVEKLLTGDAEAGRAYFNGAGKCADCHNVSGDLAGIAKKYSPINLQQRMIYPATNGKPEKTAVVTAKDGSKCEGTVTHDDEFTISVKCQDGWIRTWPREQVDVKIDDRLAAHRDLTTRYTDADMHNLFAYLETLK